MQTADTATVSTTDHQLTDYIHIYISNYNYQYFCQESWQGTSVLIDTILVCNTHKKI
jgi:hypothetical protein